MSLKAHEKARWHRCNAYVNGLHRPHEWDGRMCGCNSTSCVFFLVSLTTHFIAIWSAPGTFRSHASSASRTDGVPDWLQSAAPKPAIPTEDTVAKGTAADPEAGGLDWLQSLAPPKAAAAGAAVSSPQHGDSAGETTPRHTPGGTAGNEETEVEEVDWLSAALKGKSPAVGTAKPAAKRVSTPDVQQGGDDWLAVAKSTNQKKRGSNQSSNANQLGSAPAAFGWMSSGKLGLPAGDDSDEDVVGSIGGGGSVDNGSNIGRAKSKKKKKKTKQASPTASGPAGWLSGGALGVPTEDNSDDESDGSSHGGGGSEKTKGQAVTIETQTEEDIGAVTEGGATEKVNSPKLPPWAKPWVPPPEPEATPDPVPGTPSAPDEGTKNEVI